MELKGSKGRNEGLVEPDIGLIGFQGEEARDLLILGVEWFQTERSEGVGNFI